MPAPPDIALTPASIDALPDLLRLARDFYDEDGFATSDDDLERNLRAFFGRSSAHICLATDGGTAVGFALTTTVLILESGLVAELQDLYVVPACRGTGVGPRLIADAEQWGREQGANLIELVVAPNGRDVSRLLDYYVRHGFQNEGRRLLSKPL